MDHVIDLTIDPRMTRMLKMQRELQKVYHPQGLAPNELTGKELMDFLRTQAFALTDEVHEAMTETGWKPWATSNHINEAAFKGELVDAWHFFMNLMLAVGMTADELYEGYVLKNAKNLQRQSDGYDGVSTKCPTCKRAYDDDAVKCTPPDINSEIHPREGWCDLKRAVVRPNVPCTDPECALDHSVTERPL